MVQNPTPKLRNLATVLLGLAMALGVPISAPAATGAESQLEDLHELWLAAVDHRMLEAERRAFLALDSDVGRELFIRHFWQQRDPTPGTLDHPDLERWQRHVEAARLRYDSLDDIRAQAILIAGKPSSVTVFGGCSDVIRPFEIWRLDDITLVFFEQGGRHRGWSAGQAASLLMYGGSDQWTVERLVDFGGARGCWRSFYGPRVPVSTALRTAMDLEQLRQAVPGPRDPQWTDGFMATWAEAQLPANSLTLDYPGRYQRKTILRGRIAVPVDVLARNPAGHLFDRLVIRGDLWLGDRRGGMGSRLVDAFEVAHYIAGAGQVDGTVEITFYRRLRPGRYTLDLRLEDDIGRPLMRRSQPLVAPARDEEAPVPAGYAKGFAGLTRSEVGQLTTFPSVEILALGPDLRVGAVDLEAVTTGGPIDRVEFHLDGVPAATDVDPPYAVTLDFGPDPVPRTVTALALDPAGRELARDTAEFNTAAARFAVHLLEPVRGTAAERARAVVEVPAGETLERLDLFLGDQPLASLREPPFEIAIPTERPAYRDVLYVRALATLESGATAEDLVLIDARHPMDAIDVQWVELFTTALDASGRPVKGLQANDFRVLEDGVEQPLARFDTVESLAIHVALLMDVSSSMRRRIDTATASARRFFENVLTPRDSASLLTFSHDIRRIVPFTSDVPRLTTETVGFRAWGTTRLYDSLVYTLHSFGGLTGRRALILLSDGQDVDSDFNPEHIREAALRARVAIYPIVLGFQDPQTLTALETLARESGGSFFTISGVGGLDRIYRRIEEELRSQYLLVYEAPPRTLRREFRRVDVEVLRDGVTARTLDGYYP